MIQSQLSELAEVEAYLRDRGAQDVLVIADPVAWPASGADRIVRQWPFRFQMFDQIGTLPRFETIRQGVDAFLSSGNVDAVIAIGGGTAIDTAKLIRCFAAQGECSQDLIIDPDRIRCSPQQPLIAVPTTAGTGSEATRFAVVYLGRTKYSVAHPAILPDLSVLDWKLTRSMPPQVTAATGLDAICQAIESIWSVKANDSSRRCATEALQLGVKHLVPAFREGGAADRRAMSRAANLAGQAINQSQTTAPHALSYVLSERYRVPHGFAVALTLAPFLRLNAGVNDANVNDPRGAAHVRRMVDLVVQHLQASSVDEAEDRWLQLLRSLHCPTTLAEVGAADVESQGLIVDAVNQQRLANHPLHVSRQQLQRLVAGIAGNV